MGRIQSNVGLTTGLNIQSTVDQLLAISAQPRDRLQNRIKAFQSQQIAINELTALTIGIQLQSDRLGKSTNLSSTTAASSKSDVLAVSATGTPTVGNYSVQTLQTAADLNGLEQSVYQFDRYASSGRAGCSYGRICGHQSFGR